MLSTALKRSNCQFYSACASSSELPSHIRTKRPTDSLLPKTFLISHWFRRGIADADVCVHGGRRRRGGPLPQQGGEPHRVQAHLHPDRLLVDPELQNPCFQYGYK